MKLCCSISLTLLTLACAEAGPKPEDGGDTAAVGQDEGGEGSGAEGGVEDSGAGGSGVEDSGGEGGGEDGGGEDGGGEDSGGEDSGGEEGGGERPVRSAEGSFVIRSPELDEPLRLEIQSGVVFENLDEDGALTLALATWPEASCDVGEWFFEAPREQGMLHLNLDDPEAEAYYSWSVGSVAAAGSLGYSSLEAEGDDREHLASGGLLEGDLVGRPGGDVEVVATFAVMWCGASEAFSRGAVTWAAIGGLLGSPTPAERVAPSSR
jgi:hypothetical protein